MFAILMATPPPVEDEDAAGVDVELELLSLLEPHPAAARATTAQSTGTIRLMSLTTPPRVDPS
jgi:hypothetical protein